MEYPDITYELVSLSFSTYVLLKVNPVYLSMPECSMNDELIEQLTFASPIIEDTTNLRSPCGHTRISVLFFYTDLANTYVPLTPKQVAQKVIKEINMTCQASDLTVNNISFEYITIFPLPNFTEKSNIELTLANFKNNSIVKQKRDQYNADVVFLLTNFKFSTAVGLAGGISASKSDAFVLSNIDVADTDMTGTHELGHIVGARHQRCSTSCGNVNSCDDKSKNHGFRIGNSSGFRTVMYTNNNVCGLRRVSEWSSPAGVFMALSPTGDKDNNNRQALISNASKIACHYRTPPTVTADHLNVTISGPESTSCGQGFWIANVISTLSTPPYSYVWSVSTNGFSNWITVGSNNQISEYLLYQALSNVGCGASFFLKCTVTDSSIPQMTGYAAKQIILNCCVDNPNVDSRLKLSKDLIFWPNPATHTTFTSLSGTLEILNSSGQLIQKVKYIANSPIDLSTLNSGIYIFRLTTNESEIKIQKLIKI